MQVVLLVKMVDKVKMLKEEQQCPGCLATVEKGLEEKGDMSANQDKNIGS